MYTLCFLNQNVYTMFSKSKCIHCVFWIKIYTLWFLNQNVYTMFSESKCIHYVFWIKIYTLCFLNENVYTMFSESKCIHYIFLIKMYTLRFLNQKKIRTVILIIKGKSLKCITALIIENTRISLPNLYSHFQCFLSNVHLFKKNRRTLAHTKLHNPFETGDSFTTINQKNLSWAVTSIQWRGSEGAELYLHPYMPYRLVFNQASTQLQIPSGISHKLKKNAP